MNKELLDNNYLVIQNFIDKDDIDFMLNEIKETERLGLLNLDHTGAVENSISAMNSICATELLCQKSAEVSQILGEIVLPTYSFTRIYKNNGLLKRHSDRGACEISITLHLEGDKSWPFGIENKKTGEDTLIDLNPGDAIIYFGCIAPHFRKGRYNGRGYIQVFLHYVRSRGSLNQCLFDRNIDQYYNIDVDALKQEYKESYGY